MIMGQKQSSSVKEYITSRVSVITVECEEEEEKDEMETKLYEFYEYIENTILPLEIDKFIASLTEQELQQINQKLVRQDSKKENDDEE